MVEATAFRASLLRPIPAVRWPDIPDFPISDRVMESLLRDLLIAHWSRWIPLGEIDAALNEWVTQNPEKSGWARMRLPEGGLGVIREIVGFTDTYEVEGLANGRPVRLQRGTALTPKTDRVGTGAGSRLGKDGKADYDRIMYFRNRGVSREEIASRMGKTLYQIKYLLKVYSKPDSKSD